LFAISGGGSAELWQFPTDSPIISGVAVANGVVYLQELDGEFHAVDAATGHGLARLMTGGQMSGPSVSRGQVYVGTGDILSLFFNPFGAVTPGSIVALGLPCSPGRGAVTAPAAGGDELSPSVAPGGAGIETAGQRPTGPTLKGPLPGVLQFDPGNGLATFEGSGHLTLTGKVAVYDEFLFAPGDPPGSLTGTGVMTFVAANGDVLVSNVPWHIDPEGEGKLEFRWPGEVALRDGTTVGSTGRFVELAFKGLRATSTLERDVDWGDGFLSGDQITMTGQIVDPDPLDP
jgi:hypothetical protein